MALIVGIDLARQSPHDAVILRLGKKRLGLFLQKRYRLELEPETLEKIFQACKNAVELY